MISLLLIGVISLIVIGGTAYLFVSKNEELPEDKKTKILLIVGTVIFISFLVTTFKHRTLQFSSQAAEEGKINANRVFFGDDCRFEFDKKYDAAFEMPQEQIQQVFKRNYKSLYDSVKNN